MLIGRGGPNGISQNPGIAMIGHYDDNYIDFMSMVAGFQPKLSARSFVNQS